jgi:hypothetical protein
VVVADLHNHAIRSVATEGAVVSTLAGNEEAGLAYGQGPNVRFNKPYSVVVAANGDFIVSDSGNHSIRVLSPEGAVRTLVGNGGGEGTGRFCRWARGGRALQPAIRSRAGPGGEPAGGRLEQRD